MMSESKGIRQGIIYGGQHMVSYEPLWKTMAKRNISQYALIHKYDFDPHTLQRLRENKSITIYTIEHLCNILDCSPNDIFTFTDESKHPQSNS